jgi:hypothetical protein
MTAPADPDIARMLALEFGQADQAFWSQYSHRVICLLIAHILVDYATVQNPQHVKELRNWSYAIKCYPLIQPYLVKKRYSANTMMKLKLKHRLSE